LIFLFKWVPDSEAAGPIVQDYRLDHIFFAKQVLFIISYSYLFWEELKLLAGNLLKPGFIKKHSKADMYALICTHIV
jgi:hypothetical protein